MIENNAFEWLNKNQLSYDIWNNKYRYNNETFDEWLDRVSNGNVELRKLILEKKFLFGGRTLANRRTNKDGSFSNCYSRGFVEDDLDDLMNAATDIAKTFKAQGGQGISLSKIRPKGCGINNGQFKSDGIIPFMEIYNRVTESISQGGSRKGALIMSLDAWHKEAEDFINIKSEENKIEKANLSLEIDDEFMDCVKKYYDSGEIVNKQIKKNYNGNIIEYNVSPIKLYKMMMEKAYDWAEPACIFTNRFRNYNIMQYHSEYNIETCNPCGEQPLPKHGACNLGSINLSKFVVNPFTEFAYFDEYDFKKSVRIAVEALDDVLDENMNNHPLIEQKEMAQNYRNIGLGIMGLHDCFIKLSITYGSEQSKNFIDTIMNLMFKEAVLTSSYLAEKKGRFPKYNNSIIKSDIIKRHFTDEELKNSGIIENGLRNCSLLSIAPSGSIGTMLNISTGCEPLFQISYKRKTESLNGKDTYYNVHSGVVQEYIDFYCIESDDYKLPNYFNTSANLDWHDRIDIQSVLQNHVDTAISSTVNLPNDISMEEVEHLYLYAWEKGLKGVTIFRDGCKRIGILTTDCKNETEIKKETKPTKLERGMIIKVDNNTIGRERHLTTGCGSLHCTAFFDPVTGDLLETYLSKGSTGGCQSNLAAVSRLISLSARAGVDIETIVDQLKSCMACPAYAVRSATKRDTSKGNCCPAAVGNALIEMYKELQLELNDDYEKEVVVKSDNKNTNKTSLLNTKKITCPECGEELIPEGGCFTCKSCHYSKCD